MKLRYDASGQIVQVQTDTGEQVEVTYENGLVRSVRTSGNEVKYAWRDSDRLASVRSGDLAVDYAYEGDSLRTISVQRGGSVASATFDGELLRQVTNFLGGTWLYGYSQQGALVATTDPTGAEGRYSYDADGRLTEVRLPGGGRLQYIYGRLAGKDRKGKTTTEQVRLLAVHFLPEGQEGTIQAQAKTW